MRYGFLSTYPPTRCGLATFTRSLAVAMAEPPARRSEVVRVLDTGEEPAAPNEHGVRVTGVLRAAHPQRHADAARALNRCDAVVVQHEYGIYGGNDGDQVLAVLASLRVPVITVLHTVLQQPSPGQRRVLERVVGLSTAAVVMTERARATLLSHFRVESSKVHVIPHGAAVLPRHSVHRRGATPAILTWGLIAPGKGLERGLRAFAGLRRRGVDATYVIAGQTHPKVLAQSGEAYRDTLLQLARDLEVETAVRFVNEYLSPEDLAAHLGAADAVLLPYDSKEQATSGVLAEALAAGVPVVATAFPHAVEALTDSAGVAVPHDDLDAMTAGLERVLQLGDDRLASRRDGSGPTWSEVAERFLDLAERLRAERAA
ncbi:glycosyltransferase [Microbacterium sp. NPDC058062]|uniref:glycosyltransferase n=1 Tax=Microbacterium sp. NPDC058062 TaxID=3346320 RepID=UPI0036D91F78